MEKVEEPTVLFGKSKWIWSDNATKKNSNIIMRRSFSFGQNKPPVRAFCRIACDTHYYMFVNGVAVVWCGGLDRSVNQMYYDEIDIAKYLVKGDNVIVVHCQYFGNSGRDTSCTDRAGFIFECNDLDIYSDGTFTVYENEAYKTAPATNCRFAGYDVNYDASLEGQIQNFLDPLFNSSLFKPATDYGPYPDAVHGALLVRPVPLERFSQQVVAGKYKKSSDMYGDDKYVITLPHEMRVTPYMEIAGNGQEVVTIATDRTECAGGFGEESSLFKAHSVTYTTKPTLNVYDGMLPMTGNAIIFSMPRTVKVIKLGYREIGYNTKPTCEFSADERLDVLFEKAQTTLYCCMGATIMDSPERERNVWLGDAALAARAIYLSFADAAPLVKKTIDDIFARAKAKNDCVLYSGAPGGVPYDMPSHGLAALCEYGLFASYLDFTGDTELFRTECERLCDYLMLWDMTENGVTPRLSEQWFDNLYNIDGVLIENALYYSACKFMRKVCKLTGNYDYDEYLGDRMDNIRDFIESRWDGLGYVSHGESYDERANALVVLCGLVPDDRKEAVARILCAVRNASPYYEWAITKALVMLGRADLARKRFDSCNALAVFDGASTLGEDYNGYGSGCQAYRSSVITEAIELFGGIDITDGASKISIAPDFGAVKDFRTSLKLVTGELDVRYKYSENKIDIIIDNRTAAKLELKICPEKIGRSVEKRVIAVNKGKTKFTI